MPPVRKRESLPESNSSIRPVLAGRLGRPHGLQGFLGLYVEPEDLVYFEPGREVLVRGTPLVVRSIRPADRGHHVAFEGVNDRNAAEEIRNQDVMAHTRRQRQEGEFWADELVGLEVRPGGGTVAGLIHGPAQARLQVEREGHTFEVPFVEALVPTVDLHAGYVEIVEIDGLSES